MGRSWLSAWILAGALAATAAAAAEERRLAATGRGEVAATPDIARLALGVEARAETAEAVMAEAGDRMRATIGALEEAGVAAADIQTATIQLSPLWRRESDRERGGRRALKGYSASARLTVTLREITRVGGVLDAAIAVGANTAGGVRFALSNHAALKDRARRRAIADARRKAELYAEAAGVALGEIVSIGEAGGVAPPRPAARMAAASAMPVAPGEREITAEVSIVWRIE